MRVFLYTSKSIEGENCPKLKGHSLHHAECTKICKLNLQNNKTQLISISFKMDNQQPIVHKKMLWADNSSYMYDLPQIRCWGVSHTRGDWDCPSPPHAIISLFQPPHIRSRRRRSSPTLNSCNALVHKCSGIGQSNSQSLLKTSMFLSKCSRTYDIF
jgi:hypothetical protein